MRQRGVLSADLHRSSQIKCADKGNRSADVKRASLCSPAAVDEFFEFGEVAAKVFGHDGVVVAPSEPDRLFVLAG